MRADDFSSTLVQAVRTMGSLLDVALLLEVEPRQVYRWIAELERPSGARIVELRARLRVASAG